MGLMGKVLLKVRDSFSRLFYRRLRLFLLRRKMFPTDEEELMWIKLVPSTFFCLLCL